MQAVKTIEEIRRDWVEVLIARFGSIAALNEAIGRARTDATFSQIRNQSPDSKTGRPRTMGSDLARDTEAALNYPPGTLDNQPLMVRLESADAATRALVDIALTQQEEPLPEGLSPSVRAMVEMARAAIREEIKKKNADSGSG